jgi:glycosyltransferase involved in cell wall biosynthesis
MKKIVFDARMYGLEHAGIGRYVMNLVQKLGIQNSKFEIILLVNKKKLKKIRRDLGNKFKYIPVNSKHYSFYEQVEIPLVLRKLDPDLVHFPHFNAPILWRKDFVVTIHDLIKHYFTGVNTTTRSKLFYWLKHLGYKIQVNHALHHSKIIFVPSNFWKERLRNDFGVRKSKIIVTPEAIDPIYLKKYPLKTNQERKQILKKYQLKRPYLIYTGSVYPHKNVKVIFKALKKMPEVQLGIACSRNVFTDRVEKEAEKIGLAEQVKFLGFVPDEDLIELYKSALAMVHPSLMEGFWLSGLEAMTVGCPVIVSNASCLPEIYEKSVLYFDPYDSDQLLLRVKELTENKDLRIKMIDQGKKQVKKYSWDVTAKLTLEGYQKALKD